MKSLFERRRQFQGGLYLPARREQTAHRPIETLAPPGVLRVPLIQQNGPPASPIVRAGERVAAGQRIAEARQPGAVNVHAPRAGAITAVIRVDTARKTDVPAIELRVEEPAGPAVHDSAEWLPHEMMKGPLDAETLARLAETAGIGSFAGSGLPIGKELLLAAENQVSDLIISGMDSEPMLTGNSRLVAESLETIIDAGVWVRDALAAQHVWLAIGRDDREQIARCRAATHKTPLRLAALPSKYPQAAPTLLAYVITGRETPCGGSPVGVGVLVLDVGALTALDGARKGRPLVDRIVTVTGPGATRPGNYRICLGTRFADVLQEVGLRSPAVQVIDGGPMAGAAVESLDAVVTAQTTGIFLLDQAAAIIFHPGPCIRCGWCIEDCPAGLDPRSILDTCERGRPEEARALHPEACIECGICGYVCPAELPLTEAAVKMKGLVLAQQ